MNQEDSSLGSESDTTESYTNITSVISSTDTDDKLTPTLGQISISSSKQNRPVQSGVNKRKDPDVGLEQSRSIEGNFPHRLRTEKTQNYKLSHQGTQHSTAQFNTFKPSLSLSNKKRRLNNIFSSTPASNQTVNYNNSSCAKNLRVNDLENLLSSDFSDSSSSAVEGKVNAGSWLEQDHVGSSTNDCAQRFGKYSQNRSYLDTDSDELAWEPNMASGVWYQAGCFNRYWRHYSFVMAWYRAHMDAVQSLHSDFSRSFNMWASRRGSLGAKSATGSRGVGRNKSKQKRRLKRARNRRKEKSKHPSTTFVNRDSATSKVNTVSRGSGCNTRDEQNHEEQHMDVEMNVTDDLLDFFTTTLRHRKEREESKTEKDKEKSSATDSRVNIEQATVGQSGPSTSAPQERPGARRASEMKQLYGHGAAMIHGMETALQMTFDLTKDKAQPQLWPNMPLKFVFG